MVSLHSNKTQTKTPTFSLKVLDESRGEWVVINEGKLGFLSSMHLFLLVLHN